MSRRATVTMTAVLALVLAACSGRSTDSPTSSAPDTVAPAPIPTVIVLDASDSMNTPDAPGPRIDAAKKAVIALADGLPDKTAFGVIALGATKPAATTPIDLGCGDISTVVPVAPLDKASVTRSLEPLKAQGYTPLGAAIRAGAESLPAGTASLVVVSDGEPNCSPDPCETVATIRAARPDLTISAVGFKADVPALKCVADKGGGIYVTADNTDQLIARLTAVQNANLAATRLTTTGRGDMKLGDRLEDIRARHGDFPTTGEASGNRTVYIWKDCAYTIENGVLVEIAPLAPGSTVPGSGGSTIDGVAAGSPGSRAVQLYGEPISDSAGSATFVADKKAGTGYRIGYSGMKGVASGTVTTVMLCGCVPVEEPKPEPVLGRDKFHVYAVGFGKARPDFFSIASTASSTVSEIAWESWGSQEAVGKGRSQQNGGGQPLSEIWVLAADLGWCNGVWTYRGLQRSPTRGETTSRSSDFRDICEGNRSAPPPAEKVEKVTLSPSSALTFGGAGGVYIGDPESKIPNTYIESDTITSDLGMYRVGTKFYYFSSLSKARSADKEIYVNPDGMIYRFNWTTTDLGIKVGSERPDVEHAYAPFEPGRCLTSGGTWTDFYRDRATGRFILFLYDSDEKVRRIVTMSEFTNGKSCGFD